MYKKFENVIKYSSPEAIANVINGHRPVKLKDYRNRLCVTSSDDRSEDGVAKRFAGLGPRMTLTSSASGEVTRLLRCARNDIHCLGRSMIEMLGVLAIIGVLSVGGIAGYSKAMTKFKTNQIADQVSTIVTNIKTLYAQQKDYSELDNESAYLMGAIPDEMGTGHKLTNSFNGYVDIHSDYDDVNTFIVSY